MTLKLKLRHCGSKSLIESSYVVEGANYISIGDTLLNNIIDPEINVTITRYLENKFIIFLTFYTTYAEDNYSGMIEFDFDLNNYL